MKKKLIVILALLCVLFCTSCGEEPVSEDYTALSNAVQTLKGMDRYIIVNSMVAPDSVLNYIDVVAVNGDYIEVPIDEDSNIGMTGVENGFSAFMLSDYNMKDGGYYSVVTDEDGESFAYRYPDSYGQVISSRKYMYLDELLDKFSSIEYNDEVTVDIGNGLENLKVYKCILPSSEVPSLFGKTNKAVYECLLNETSDEAVKTLCEYYIKDYDMMLTFSDAEIYVGVDASSVPKYIDITVGGLGTKLNYSMSLLTQDFTERVVPDFSNAISYEDFFKEIANEVVKYDSIEEGLDAITSSFSE